LRSAIGPSDHPSVSPTALLALAWLVAAPAKRPNMPVGWTWPPSTAMQQAGKRCLAELDAAKIEYRRAPGVKKISTPILVPELTLGALELVPLRKRHDYPMDCQLAAALHAVGPALAQLGVVALRFRTLHEYRNVVKNGRTTKMLSRHAIGLAIDVFELELEGGRILVVERDWKDEPVLRAVTEVIDASELFRTPLSPGNDPVSHDDHIHLEAHLRIGS
jgi:hypothetical protein